MIPSRPAHFVVIVGQMHDELIDSRRKRRELLLVPVQPIFRCDTRLHRDHALNGGLLLAHRNTGRRTMGSRWLQQNRECVFIAQLSVHAKKFRG